MNLESDESGTHWNRRRGGRADRSCCLAVHPEAPGNDRRSAAAIWTGVRASRAKAWLRCGSEIAGS